MASLISGTHMCSIQVRFEHPLLGTACPVREMAQPSDAATKYIVYCPSGSCLPSVPKFPALLLFLFPVRPMQPTGPT